MSGAAVKAPKAATVEDWDDDAETTLPGTRTSAKVASKKTSSPPSVKSTSSSKHKNAGTDSGYSSKAPTVLSMASTNRKTSDLKVDTGMMTERQRTPYTYSATKDTADRQIPGRQKKETKPQKATSKPFCHEKGTCWSCDKYGRHFTQEEVDELEKKKKEPAKTSKATNVVTTPPSPTATRTSSTKAQVLSHEPTRPAATRRLSVTTRPVSMYAAPPVETIYQQPHILTGAWPGAVASPQGIVHPQYFTTTATPVAVPQAYYTPSTPVYHEPPVYLEDIARRPSRRMSVSQQERPVLQRPATERPVVERRMSKSTAQRPVLQEKRPSAVSHKSSRSVEIDKHAVDRERMPPPARPVVSTTSGSARPRAVRAPDTYHAEQAKRRSVQYENYSTDESDFDDPLPPVHPSPSRRPPSAYKAPVPQETSDRPSLTSLKAHSYTDGQRSIQVANSSDPVGAMPRRTTTGSMTMEEKEAAAEAYQRKRGSHGYELTAENLSHIKKIASRTVEQRSEAGSTASHRTHHSSSKDSSIAANRATSIKIDNISLRIAGDPNDGPATPVTIGLPNSIQISINKENIDSSRRPVKQLERASSTSMSSRPSRRSLTNSSQLTGSHLRREDPELLALEGPQNTSRRPSYVDEYEKELLRSNKNSRQPSRTGSARPSIEGMRRATNGSNRNSVDIPRTDDMNLYAI